MFHHASTHLWGPWGHLNHRLVGVHQIWWTPPGGVHQIWRTPPRGVHPTVSPGSPGASSLSPLLPITPEVFFFVPFALGTFSSSVSSRDSWGVHTGCLVGTKGVRKSIHSG